VRDPAENPAEIMGPRRTTISFSSEDAPEIQEHKVYA
jgi:hypothetical protein